MIFLKRYRRFIVQWRFARTYINNCIIQLRVNKSVRDESGHLSIYDDCGQIKYTYHILLSDNVNLDKYLIVYEVNFKNIICELRIRISHYYKYRYVCTRTITSADGVETIMMVKKTDKHDTNRLILKFPREITLKK